MADSDMPAHSIQPSCTHIHEGCNHCSPDFSSSPRRRYRFQIPSYPSSGQSVSSVRIWHLWHSRPSAFLMHFHLYSLIRWELDVVMARLFMRRDRADKGDDPLVAPHPDINITRRAMQAIWIQQRIPPVLSGCSF